MFVRANDERCTCTMPRGATPSLVRAWNMAASEFTKYFREGFALRNRIFILRHGLAESNVKRVLVTKPEAGTTAWGLVEEGKEQAKNAAMKLRDMVGPIDGEQIVVVSSDFTRTRETAEIVHATLNVKTPLRHDRRLRERDMGDLDLKVMSTSNKPSIFDIWEDDEKDVSCAHYNVESVESVAIRMSAAVKAVDQEFEDKVVVLVSHQDPLHILNSLFIGVPLPMHRKKQEPPIGNCDIRELKTA